MVSPRALDALSGALSTAQAARRLKVSEAWVRRLVVAGRLPAVSTPLGRLIDPDAVDELARRREREGGTRP